MRRESESGEYYQPAHHPRIHPFSGRNRFRVHPLCHRSRGWRKSEESENRPTIFRRWIHRYAPLIPDSERDCQSDIWNRVTIVRVPPRVIALVIWTDTEICPYM